MSSIQLKIQSSRPTAVFLPRSWVGWLGDRHVGGLGSECTTLVKGKCNARPRGCVGGSVIGEQLVSFFTYVVTCPPPFLTPLCVTLQNTRSSPFGVCILLIKTPTNITKYLPIYQYLQRSKCIKSLKLILYHAGGCCGQ